jgi:hypothetical protein
MENKMLVNIKILEQQVVDARAEVDYWIEVCDELKKENMQLTESRARWIEITKDLINLRKQ